MIRLAQVAGFDFEKKVLLIKTTKTYLNNECKRFEPVYETQPITDDEMQVILDAYLDYKDSK